MTDRLVSKGTAAAFAVGEATHKERRGCAPGLKRVVAAHRANTAQVTANDVAWVLRVHSVGEEAARRSKDWDHGKGSVGWQLTLREARALLEVFNMERKASLPHPERLTV